MSGPFAESLPAAEFLKVSAGESWDQDSFVSLYHTEGEAPLRFNPGLNAIGAPVMLRSTTAPSVTKSGTRRIYQPPGSKGDAGIWDMRRGWRADVGAVSAINFTVSLAYLDGMQSGSRKDWASILGADKDICFSDDVLVGLSIAAAAALRAPCAVNKLLLSHIFAAAATRLVFRGGIDPADLAGSSESLQYLVARAKDFMASNLESEVSLAEVAAACGVSLPYLSRAFRKSTGTSPYRWLMQERINRAKGFLSIPGNTLVGVALTCGFANQSHFTRCFSQVVGISPGRWRRLHGWSDGQG